MTLKITNKNCEDKYFLLSFCSLYLTVSFPLVFIRILYSMFLQAKGFEITYLSKVPEVKDTVHKKSLLQHLTQLVVEKFPDTTDLYSELGALTRCSRVCVALQILFFFFFCIKKPLNLCLQLSQVPAATTDIAKNYCLKVWLKSNVGMIPQVFLVLSPLFWNLAYTPIINVLFSIKNLCYIESILVVLSSV